MTGQETILRDGQALAIQVLADYVHAERPTSAQALIDGLAQALAIAVAGATETKAEYRRTVRQIRRFLLSEGEALP